MGVTCQILIKKPTDGVHKAGETVSGSVRFTIDKPFKFKDIILSLNGDGFCFFPSFKPSKTFSQACIGEHAFVRQIKYLNHGELHGETRLLPIATYEDDFSFTLPKDIPHPYKDKFCKLTYLIKLSFIKENCFGNKEFSAPLSILTYVKPEQPEGKVPFVLEKTLFRPFSNKNHTIKIKGEFSNSIFTPGKKTELSFNVTNDTDTDMQSIDTKIICYTTYRGDCGRSKEVVEIIEQSTVETPGVPANGVASLTSVMQVPENLFSIQNCKIIKRQYKVRVSVRLNLPYTNIYTEIPVVIGHKYDNKIGQVSTINANTVSSPLSFSLERTLFKPFSHKIHTIKLKGEISNTLTSGQTADLSFTVNNDTDTTIASVETILVCYTTLEGKVTRKDIMESAVETTGVPANSIANLSCLMHIPTDAKTMLYTETFKIEYKVRVTVRLYFPYVDAFTEFPIVISDEDKNKRVTRVDEEYTVNTETSGKDDNTSVKISEGDDKGKKDKGTVSENSGPSSEEAAAEVREEYEDNPPSYWEIMKEEKN